MLLKAFLMMFGAAFAVCIAVYLFSIYRQAFVFFPPIFFITNLPIPGIGSPERLFTSILLLIFVMLFGMRDQKGSIDLSVLMSFVLFVLAFAPSISYSPIAPAKTLTSLISRLSLVVFVFLVVKNIISRRQINDCVFGISLLIILLGLFCLFAIAMTGSINVLRESVEDAPFFRQGVFKLTVLNNPTYLSRIVLICLPFIFFAFARRPALPWRKYYLVIFVLCVLLLFATVSKLAFATFLLNVTILFFYFRKKERRFFRIIFVVILIGGLAYGSTLAQRFSNLAGQYERKGTLLRVMLWHAAFEGFLENPFFGNGPGAESELYQMERHGGVQYLTYVKQGTAIPRSPHNSYLSIALQGGLAAIATFFLFLAFYARSIYKRLKKARLYRDFFQDRYFELLFICSLLSLMNLLIGCMFSGVIWMNLVWFILGLSLAGASVFEMDLARIRRSSQP